MGNTVDIVIPSLGEIFNSLRKEYQTEHNRKELGFFYGYELSTMLKDAQRAQEPQIRMNLARHGGSQDIIEFWANDMAKPKGNDINWHGQNTSQWVYAGAIIVDAPGEDERSRSIWTAH